MRVQVTVHVEAAPGRVWEVLEDVEHWPEWTSSITSVKKADDAPIGPGSSAVVKQPRMPKAKWVVTEFEPGRSFTWDSNVAGAHTKAGHYITEVAPGQSRVDLVVDLKGPLVPVFAPIVRPFIRKLVSTEAAGLKRRSEQAA